MDKSKHLQEVLESSTRKHIESLMSLHLDKKKKVIEALQKKFGSLMATNPINSGSYAKSTYINQKFDLDFCIPFKRDAFSTLKEMSEDVLSFFEQEYKAEDSELTTVRHQKTSIGLLFRSKDTTTNEFHDIDIDVVPGRELKKDDYKESGNLNLYLKPDENGDASSIQTNIRTHIDTIKGKNKERQIIRLLKVFKLSQGIQIKSFLLELITIRAFEKEGDDMSTDLWESLKTVMAYIRDNIETILVKDPANSANIVSATLGDIEKSLISSQFKNCISNIEALDSFLESYFPISTVVVIGNLGFTSQSGASQLKTESFG